MDDIYTRSIERADECSDARGEGWFGYKNGYAHGYRDALGEAAPTQAWVDGYRAGVADMQEAGEEWAANLLEDL